MQLSTLLALAPLAALGWSMAREDMATTRVALWKLAAFTAMALAWGLATGALAQGRGEALVGSALAAGTGLLVGWLLSKRLGREAFGGADVWILAGGGAVIGAQWVGPWIGLSVFLGLATFLFAARQDHEHPDGRAILPFVPTLLLALAPIALGRAFDLLPPIPF